MYNTNFLTHLGDSMSGKNNPETPTHPAQPVSGSGSDDPANTNPAHNTTQARREDRGSGGPAQPVSGSGSDNPANTNPSIPNSANVPGARQIDPSPGSARSADSNS